MHNVADVLIIASSLFTEQTQKRTHIAKSRQADSKLCRTSFPHAGIFKSRDSITFRALRTARGHPTQASETKSQLESICDIHFGPSGIMNNVVGQVFLHR